MPCDSASQPGKLICLEQPRHEALATSYCSQWLSSRNRAVLSTWNGILQEELCSKRVRVLDLTHIFGRRLRATGVSFEDRQDLLGHKSSRFTTHYSQSELASLIEAAEKVCAAPSRKTPATTWVRR
jgi:hypothetical protein